MTVVSGPGTSGTLFLADHVNSKAFISFNLSQIIHFEKPKVSLLLIQNDSDPRYIVHWLHVNRNIYILIVYIKKNILNPLFFFTQRLHLWEQGDTLCGSFIVGY